ncbi:hypothetical protein KR067_008485 [Drosophila pandora]|nr:hypothetical protein KR067_008485 [Drosophila pandora]
MNVKMLYISYMSQYVVTVSEAQLTDNKVLGPDVVTSLHFLQEFIHIAGLPLKVLQQRIPNILLSEFEYMATPFK